MVTYRTYRNPDGGWWIEIKDGLSSGSYPTRDAAIVALPDLVARGKLYEEQDRLRREAIEAAEWLDDPALD